MTFYVFCVVVHVLSNTARRGEPLPDVDEICRVYAGNLATKALVRLA